MLVDHSPLSCGFLSTYPPTQCGLASFTASLLDAVSGSGASGDVGVVRLVDQAEPPGRPEVVHHHRGGSRSSLDRSIEVLNSYDMVIAQHEYGIYAGPDGAEILDILAGLHVPSIVVLHTVLVHPSVNQRFILEQICKQADVVITMSRAACRRLLEGYAVDPGRVAVIPHGAHDHRGPAVAGMNRPPTILTWGLLGPGKGIERALEAVAMLGDLDPQPRYVVAGQTHPKIREQSGESYRRSLLTLAAGMGIAERVVFEDGYRDLASLGELIRSADVVLLPYDSREQVTSGVLIEAVTTGRPVIATAFPHAVELLGSGAGLVVPHGQPVPMAAALRRVLTEDGLAGAMAAEAGRMAPDMLWAAVAESYVNLARQLVSDRSSAVA
jgi:glycosyltransferase involved in cell wall biosynthesis